MGLPKRDAELLEDFVLSYNLHSATGIKSEHK